MALLTILVFFAVCFSLGFGLASFAKEGDNFLERNLMRLGIGLGSFITLGLLLNILRIPLDYKIFLGIGTLCMLLSMFRNKRALRSFRVSLRLTKATLFIIAMLALFSVTLFMYYKGAFSYPYLEDDDSWSHAIGAKYVSIEKTVFAKGSGIHYIDPYPPSYDMVIGILHQTNNSLYWTLKFFNALLISSCIIFFYFFSLAFMKSQKKALFSTLALFAMPAFLSHFIWAISITMPLFFVSFYAVEKIKDDKNWWIVSAVVIAATLTTSPSHSAYFGIFLVVYLAARILSEKKILLYELLAGFFGIILSLILWWGPMIAKHGVKGTLADIGTGSVSILTVAGTADRVYNISDFIFAKSANMINNPIGIGLVLSLLLMVFLVFLAFKYKPNSKKSIIAAIVILLIIEAVLVVALNYSYVKNPAKRGLQQAKKGSISFAEFISDQFFLVLFLSIMAYLAISLFLRLYQGENLKDQYLFIVLLWAIFSFYAVNAAPFYYRLTPFRAWIILAIPVALLCGESINLITGFVRTAANALTKSSAILTIISMLIIAVLVYGIITTSFVQKYAVNTLPQWTPGGFWTSGEEIQGYVWLRDNLPPNSKIFTFSNDATIIGMDNLICHWCQDVQDYKKVGFNQTPEENHAWLIRGQYKYLIIDGQTFKKFGANETNSKIYGLINSGKFKPAFGNNGMVLLGVV